MVAEYDYKNPQALARLLGNGVKLQRYPKDVLIAAQKAAAAIYEEEAAKNPIFKKIYTDWLAFRNVEHRWFSLTEATMEQFMYSSQLKK